ncbi:MAG: DEAD/DEAH box helicase [Cyclobacteriaceae bacterium]|nr:DEAD/DEAH box helicase [Cyclobacteriaceae bacterium]
MSKKNSEFDIFKLNPQLLRAIEDNGYQNPTPVQIQTIPLISAGHDVLGIAQTGTGKTAAYLLPLLMKIKFAQGMFCRAIIIVPTRELVVQVENNARSFTKYLDIRIVSIYGGTGTKQQIEAIENGLDILICTPGRFLDLYRKGHINTREIKTMVLDEADKMMDMGFMPQIREILEKIPVKRQNLLFSATFAEKVERLASEFLEYPIKVEVSPQATPAETVSQFYYKVPNFLSKINLLQYLLQDKSLTKVIIFVRTKETANNVFKFIHRKIEESVRVIHSNKAQQTRLNAMRDFKEGDIRILVSTDVSARGHDISYVSHVINFDLPMVYEDYVHRIGRTGRAANLGTAISFLNDAEFMHFRKIEKLIRQNVIERNWPEGVVILPTGKEERKSIEMDIDKIKRAENPDFKGAFHEKKNVAAKKSKFLTKKKRKK